uniref:Uncharacterized protein n=1 Tax=Nothobranchius pienaari TaxID=704102 RepID=A0A1A8MI84_9TELE
MKNAQESLKFGGCMHPVRPVALPGPREPEPRSTPEASLGLTIWPCSFKLSGRTLHLLNRCLVLFCTTGSIGFTLLYQVLTRGTIALDVKRWASMGCEMLTLMKPLPTPGAVKQLFTSSTHPCTTDKVGTKDSSTFTV